MPEEEKTIKDFEQLTGLLKKKEICKRTVVVWPEEDHTQEAILQATHEGFISPILVCSERTKKIFADREALQAVTAENPEEASRIAVKIIREQKADIIMKGFVNTDVLLRAILDKEHGILPRGAVLTHITVTKIPEYPKLLFFTDAAVIPYPT